MASINLTCALIGDWSRFISVDMLLDMFKRNLSSREASQLTPRSHCLETIICIGPPCIVTVITHPLMPVGSYTMEVHCQSFESLHSFNPCETILTSRLSTVLLEAFAASRVSDASMSQNMSH